MYPSQEAMPTSLPTPNPLTRYVISPPEDGYRIPSFAQTYPINIATPPPTRNEIQTAEPATAPASPSSAKIPAPIIEPIPSTVAPRSVRVRGCPVASAGATGTESVTPALRLSTTSAQH